MVRTTPPRPTDVLALVPELARQERTATRLHPRPGAPMAADSSVGGPMRWPADEPWPTCRSRQHDAYALVRPDEERRRRAVVAAAWGRDYTTEEQAYLRGIWEARQRERPVVGRDPVPLLPVAQLYARDVPDLPCPPGTDLLQVLWCPLDHPDEELPAVLLRWRDSAAVTDLLAAPPEPELLAADYLPNPCVVHPERITEYPSLSDAPAAAEERIRTWDVDDQIRYQYDLSVAPGWKVGGWAAPWTFRDASPVVCACGATGEPLLTVDSTEWDGGTGSWRPTEDDDATDHADAVGVTIGRAYTMQVYRCPADPGHPAIPVMQ
ncbi:hypothetical protein [Actinocatenispora rupis]|uniref:Uncharacterized protein n=1 Tax=Actinocatenispora rupis TaxID=519421 RepID=A0A8J3JEM1_9ACTN|nr:hypothetical protein [Actinocatenispora rupis]GID15294.1 hypothetical protein Aru02nite_61830 [Actinocatenispora rupis]